MRNSAIGVYLFLCFTSTLASAGPIPWHTLSPAQQEALAPLVQQWDGLSETQQDHLLKTAKRYPHMTPEQKQRYQDRLPVWIKLHPDQREAARKKYRAFNKVPAEKREQVKQMVKQDQEKNTQQAASGVPAATSSTNPQ